MNDIRGMGIENRGFSQEVPKSPWRYPFRRAQAAQNGGLQRTISQDSTSTIASAANIQAASTTSPAGVSTSSQSLRKEALSRMLPP